MEAKRARIRIDQYADNQFTWSWISGGVAVDFTGCTATFDLRVSPNDAAPLLVVTTTPTSSGSIVLGTPTNALGAGIIQLNLSKVACAALTPSVAHGNLLVTFAGGSPTWAILSIDAAIDAGNTY